MSSNIVVLLVSDLPHLQHVVVGDGGHHETLVQIPGEVADPVGVATVHKQKLGRTVLLFLLSLRSAEARQVPGHDATVHTRGGDQVALHRAETDVVDVLLMAFQRE